MVRVEDEIELQFYTDGLLMPYHAMHQQRRYIEFCSPLRTKPFRRDITENPTA